MSTNVSEVHRTERTITVVGRAITYLVYFYFVVVEIILALGFVLLLFGANPTSSFVQWVYRALERAMRPFRGIFAPIELGTTGNDVPAVFDTSVLFAMIVYGIVVLALSSLISWLTSRISRIDLENRKRRELAAYAETQAQVAAYRGASTTSPAAPTAPTAGTAGAPGAPAPPPADAPPPPPASP